MLENCNIPILNKEKINHYETEYMIDKLGGEGRMYCIDVYNGVQIIYNRFHYYCNFCVAFNQSFYYTKSKYIPLFFTFISYCLYLFVFVC